MQKFDGIVIVNKNKNCTSHDIVQRVKKIFNQKVGHTGTLDPLATGVLPILIGKGTLCSKYLINHDKEYKAVIQLGKRTETADSEGAVLEEKEVKSQMLQKDVIERVLEGFIGEQEQVPPMYSAIKVNGKKLYEYARKGQEIRIEPRKIHIYDLQLLNINEQDKQIEVNVSCSKGTYIRTLCEDIAKNLGTVGYMLELNRTKVGDFVIENSVSVDELEDNKGNVDFLNSKLISLEKLFCGSGKVVLDERMIRLFLNGVKLSFDLGNGIYEIYAQTGEFIGIGVVENNLLKRDIVV